MTTEFSGGRAPEFRPTITFVEDSPTRRPRVDLNKADIADLRRLPGISEATARRIVAARAERAFLHVDDLLVGRLVSPATLARIRKMVSATIDEDPYVHTIATRPERATYGRPFALEVGFDDSAAGTAVVRLQVDSVSHSLDLTREVTEAERREHLISFEMPAMEPGIVNVQATLYDAAGRKDYFASTLAIFHSRPSVTFFPSSRTLRLVDGAAQMKSDGRFHCDSNFFFSNGTPETRTLGRIMTWRITRINGAQIESGTWDWGSNIVLFPWTVSTGWWFTFAFPPGNATFNRLRAKDPIRIVWEFTEIGTGAPVASSLTWRAVLGPHVNIIRVGEENFTPAERTLVFNSLRNTAASIYQQQDLDIGTIRTFFITVAQAGGYVTINSDGEAEDLTEDWTVSNDGLDLFIVRAFDKRLGVSPKDGPCDKNAKGINGVVVELQSTQALLGMVMAHEMGHYLGLGHSTAPNNLMHTSASASNTLLTGGQASTMKGHCSIRFLA